MSESVIEIRNRLRRQSPVAALPTRSDDSSVGCNRQIEPALVLEDEKTHRITVTTPLREAAGVDNLVTRLTGRMVEAENANRNGAFWTSEDLEFGLPTVAHGPLNWLHNEQKVIGALLNPALVGAKEAAAEGVGPYIRTEAVAWNWINQDEIRALQHFVGVDQAWFSMECISEKIQCAGPKGCGKEFAYRGAELCEHLRDRSSFRRLQNPMFMGAAVIVPPTRPGWANADLDFAKADRVLEAASFKPETMNDSVANQMVAQIMAWAAR